MTILIHIVCHRGYPCAIAALAGVGDRLGGDEPLVRRFADVEQVDAAEHAMPVGAVALPGPQRIQRVGSLLAAFHPVHLTADEEHLFVQ